jgi:hypothetical protein
MVTEATMMRIARFKPVNIPGSLVVPDRQIGADVAGARGSR